MAEHEDEDWDFARRVHFGNRHSDSESTESDDGIDDEEFLTKFALPAIEIRDDFLDVISLPNAWEDRKNKNEQSESQNSTVSDCLIFNQNWKPLICSTSTSSNSQWQLVEQKTKSKRRGKNKKNNEKKKSLNKKGNDQQKNRKLNTNTNVLNTIRSDETLNRNTHNGYNSSENLDFSKEVQLFFDIFNTIPQLAHRREDSGSSLSTGLDTCPSSSQLNFSNVNKNEFPRLPSKSLKSKITPNTTNVAGTSYTLNFDKDFPSLSHSVQPSTHANKKQNSCRSNIDKNTSLSPSKINENILDDPSKLSDDKAVNPDPNKTKKKKYFKLLDEEEVGFTYTTGKEKHLKSDLAVNTVTGNKKGPNKQKNKTIGNRVALTINNVISSKKSKNNKSKNKPKQSNKIKMNETVMQINSGSLKIYDDASKNSIKENNGQLVEVTNIIETSKINTNSNTEDIYWTNIDTPTTVYEYDIHDNKSDISESTENIELLTDINTNRKKGGADSLAKSSEIHLQTKFNKSLNKIDNLTLTHIDDTEHIAVNNSTPQTNNNEVNNTATSNYRETELKSLEATSTGNSIIFDKVNNVGWTFEITEDLLPMQVPITAGANDSTSYRNDQMSQVDSIKNTDEVILGISQRLDDNFASTSTVAANSVLTRATIEHENLRLEEEHLSVEKVDNMRLQMDVLPLEMNCDNSETREISLVESQNVTIRNKTKEETPNPVIVENRNDYLSVLYPILETMMPQHLSTQIITGYVILVITVSFLRWVAENSLYFLILILLHIFAK